MLRKIGQSGISVRAIGFGTMPLSIQGRPLEEKAIEVLHAALDKGTDFIDTADVYCLDDNDLNHNERLIKKALDTWDKNKQVYVATKGGCGRPEGKWVTRGTPQELREACLRSLEALGLDSIFLYQLHAPDDKVPFEKSIEMLAQLKGEGLVQHLGLSNVNLNELKRAQKITRIETVQNRCHPFFQKDFNNGFIKSCHEQSVTYIAYSPVGGWSTHKHVAGDFMIKEIAQKYSVSPYRVILSWLLSKGENILPIPAASRIESAQDSPDAIDLVLDDKDKKRIDDLGSVTY